MSESPTRSVRRVGSVGRKGANQGIRGAEMSESPTRSMRGAGLVGESVTESNRNTCVGIVLV